MKFINISIVIFFLFTESKAQTDLLIPYQENDKWGFIDTNMNIVIRPEYDSVSIFHNDRSIIQLDEKFGVIDEQGKFILKPKFKNISISFDIGLITVIRKNGEQLFYNDAGKEINYSSGFSYCGNGVPDYLNIEDYSIQKEDKIALIYTKVIPDEYYNPIYIKDTTDYVFTSIENYGSDSFVVRDSIHSGIWIPEELYIKILFKYDDIEVTKGLFQDDFLHKYEIGGKLGLLDIDGNIICEAKYYSIYFDHNNRKMDSLIKVEYEPAKFGYINDEGIEYF